MPQLEGKVAWVTGAGSGIGEAAALMLAEEGASVVLTGRRREPLESVAARIHQKGRQKGGANAPRGYVQPCDLTIPDDVSRIGDYIARPLPQAVEGLIVVMITIGCGRLLLDAFHTPVH